MDQKQWKKLLSEGKFLTEGNKVGKLKFEKWGAYSMKKSNEDIAQKLEFAINNATLDSKVLNKLDDPRVSVTGKETGLQIKYNESNYTKAVLNAYEKLITKVASKL